MLSDQPASYSATIPADQAHPDGLCQLRRCDRTAGRYSMGNPLPRRRPTVAVQGHPGQRHPARPPPTLGGTAIGNALEPTQHTATLTTGGTVDAIKFVVDGPERQGQLLTPSAVALTLAQRRSVSVDKDSASALVGLPGCRQDHGRPAAGAPARPGRLRHLRPRDRGRAGGGCSIRQPISSIEGADRFREVESAVLDELSAKEWRGHFHRWWFC